MKNSSVAIAAFIFSVSFAKSFCQVTPVRIGEVCPDVTLTHIVNFKTDHASISGFKGKLLILDFWATWCAPCVSMIPVTESLQKQFAGKLQILAVTSQDEATVTKFFTNMKQDKNISMPSVTGDRELAILFPHIEIPHYVWLDENSKVIAITGAEQVTAEVIGNFLDKNSTALPVKTDEFKTIAEQAPLFVTGNELIEGNNTRFEKIPGADLLYHSVITKYINGFGCEQAVDSERITCKNSPVGDLYRIAAAHYNLLNLGYNSTIWETQNPLVKLMNDSASVANSKTRAEIDNWMSQYTWCYELKFPKELKDKKYDLMLADLNNYFGSLYNIVGVMEIRKVKCLALIETAKHKITATSSAANQYSVDEYHLQLKNASVNELLKLLSINLDRLPPLIDETGEDAKLDIDLNCNMSDIYSLNRALGNYGFQLVEKMADREMVVIRDKPSKE